MHGQPPQHGRPELRPENCSRRQVVFDAVAAHRFRDISEEVRSVVIVGIGQWIDLMPSMFLQDAYLKYVAWALSDKVKSTIWKHVSPGSKHTLMTMSHLAQQAILATECKPCLAYTLGLAPLPVHGSHCTVQHFSTHLGLCIFTMC